MTDAESEAQLSEAIEKTQNSILAVKKCWVPYLQLAFTQFLMSEVASQAQVCGLTCRQLALLRCTRPAYAHSVL